MDLSEAAGAVGDGDARREADDARAAPREVQDEHGPVVRAPRRVRFVPEGGRDQVFTSHSVVYHTCHVYYTVRPEHTRRVRFVPALSMLC
jgi:hypothetical protein